MMKMEILSGIALVLLSLVGYSGGAVGRAGKRRSVSPTALDLILVVFIWGGAIYSRRAYDFETWLLIPAWMALSAVLGGTAVSLRRLPDPAEIEPRAEMERPPGRFTKSWARWKRFSLRMGGFQSRMILSFFYFILVTPAALIIKALADPLRLKRRRHGRSDWIVRPESPAEIEEFRRQF